MMLQSFDVDVDALLMDARTVTIRTVQPSDADALRAMYEGVSTDALRLRFFSWSKAAVTHDIEAITRAASDDHASLLAEIGSRVVGVATFERLAGEPTHAEVAFLVDDAHRGQGIGTLLLEQLAALAAKYGIVRFIAETLPVNSPMLHVFRDVGLPLVTQHGTDVVHVELPLDFDDDFRAATDGREAHADAKSLDRVLAPRSIAVVGAGSDPQSLGHQLLANIVRGGYRGALHAVNKSGHRIAGVAAYTSLDDVPALVDLVIVAVPNSAVLGVAQQAAAHHVAGLVVITAGFAESGPAGAQRQHALVQVCREAGMRLIGPNSMGIANPHPMVALNATFSVAIPPAGTIGLMSQSGAVGMATLAYASRRGVGISTFVSAGNKADVSGNDLLAAWESDDATRACALYLESFGNPRKFARVAARVGRRKPVLVVKSGRTAAATRGMTSQPVGAMTPDIAVDGLFEQAGVTRVDSLSELFDVATLFDLARFRRHPVRRLSPTAQAQGGSQPTPATRRGSTSSRSATFPAAGSEPCSPVGPVAIRSTCSRPPIQSRSRQRCGCSSATRISTPSSRFTRRSSPGRLSVSLARSRPSKPMHLASRCSPASSDSRRCRRNCATRLVARQRPSTPSRAGRTRSCRRSSLRRVERTSDSSQRHFDDIDIPAARAIVAAALLEIRLVAGSMCRQQQLCFDPRGQSCQRDTRRNRLRSRAATIAFGTPVALKASAGDLVHKAERGGVRLNLRSALEVAAAFTSMEKTSETRCGGAR